jgi:radical SAM protein with 4Fe4S-binding SPASM domain
MKSIQEQWKEHYDKLYKEGKLEPTYAVWFCTKACNLKCNFCGRDSRETSKNELNTNEAKNMVKELMDLGCKNLSITGGEPTLRKDIWEILGFARDCGIENLGFITNGFLLDKFKREIEKLEINFAGVSLDGYRRHHDELRGMHGVYEKALNTLDLFQEICIPNRKVVTVCTKISLEDLPLMISDAFKHGCTNYRIQNIIPEGRAKDMENTKEEIKRALEYVLLYRKKGFNIEASENFGFLGNLEMLVRPYHFFCSAGLSLITIFEDGTIGGCSIESSKKYSEGNIRERSLKSIWENGFIPFRESGNIKESCRNCRYFKQCMGGCWAQRVNSKRFCYVNIANKLAERESLI